MEGMTDWSLAARRSREVLVKMYEASKRPITRQTSPRLGPVIINGPHGGMGGGGGPQGEMMDPSHQQHMHQQHYHQNVEMEGEEGMIMLEGQGVWDLDGMLWGNMPDGLDMPYDGLPLEYEDHHVVGGNGGPGGLHGNMDYDHGGGYMMQQ